MESVATVAGKGTVAAVAGNEKAKELFVDIGGNKAVATVAGIGSVATVGGKGNVAAVAGNKR